MTIGKPPPLSILVLLTAFILILEEPETPKPQSKPEEKENKTVEDPEEELIEDDIDDEDVDDPDDEVIEIESNKKDTPSTSTAHEQPQPQTRQGIVYFWFPNPYWQISGTVLLENSFNPQLENSGASYRPFYWKSHPKESI